MAYDQGYYQPPSRPYNGSAARPPAAPQQYPPQQQAYASQGPYDQYAPNDGYGGGYDEYGGNGGYSQEQGYDDGYQQPVNGGGRGGGGRGYPPQNQAYPPQQQEYYGNGGPPRGGGDPRSQNSGSNMGRGGYGSRPAPPDGGRGGYDSRGGPAPRGNPTSNRNAPQGRGGRPAPLERNGSSDPGSQRRPGGPPQKSPQEMSWDNPFPGFPGQKKKSSMSEEQKITSQMAGMNMNDAPRPRTGGGSNGQQRRGPPGPDGYGRPSMDSQTGQSSRPAPAQYQQPGYGEQRPGPGPGPRPGPGGRVAPRQNNYGPGYEPGYEPGYGPGFGSSESMPTSPVKSGFASPSRANTMPTEMNMNAAMGGTANNRFPAQAEMDFGPSAPYNGPVGRMPPRPSTATGVRPIPQRTYPPQAPRQPPPQQVSQQQSHGGGNDSLEAPELYPHRISNIYDDYYHSHPNERGSVTSDPGAPSSGRGLSMDGQMQQGQVNGYPAGNPQQSQPDFRAQVQPQSAVYEMVGDAPPMPNGNPREFQNGGYDQYGNSAPSQHGPRGPPNAGGYGNGPFAQQDPRNGAPYKNGAPAGMVGLPQRPSPPVAPEALPSHPPPVRAGLIPNSAPLTSKPPPVRNYNNTSPAVISQRPPQTQHPTSPPVPEGPPPVTMDEIERLRVMVKANPNDQANSLLLARKLVEASEVLVPQIPEQRARNKARERYVGDAHKLLKRLCSTASASPSSPQADAMFFLADCLGRGCLGTEPDNKEAFTLYQNAAKAGHAAAAYRTAVCCELGQEEGGGTRKDPLKAIQWYKRAAMLGDTPAMYKMGMIQLKGLLGQPKDGQEAITWLKRAAEKADAENPHALHELGLLYEAAQPPQGVVRDEAYSLSLFQQAAELGYKFSQYRLGCAYEYGLFNLPIDPRQSILWYSRSAVQEEHQSELALSGWYLTGSEGVIQQSDTEAYLWARKAAMAGLAKAEYAMGYFTEVGIGAPADLEGAKRWYWRAAAQNFPKARERLEDLKRGGNKPQLKARERISRSKIGKQNEGECTVM